MCENNFYFIHSFNFKTFSNDYEDDDMRECDSIWWRFMSSIAHNARTWKKHTKKWTNKGKYFRRLPNERLNRILIFYEIKWWQAEKQAHTEKKSFYHTNNKLQNIHFIFFILRKYPTNMFRDELNKIMNSKSWHIKVSFMSSWGWCEKNIFVTHENYIFHSMNGKLHAFSEN